MATTAQILANRENSTHSTGPKSEAGKAAASQNATTHGLSGAFRLLQAENPAEFDELLASLTAEHNPETHTEYFLVREMAQAEWRLRRAAAMEAELLAGAGPAAGIPDAILKLNRYEQSARRAFYKALAQLRAMRIDDENAERRRHALSRVQLDRMMEQTLFAPMPPSSLELAKRMSETKPMPIHLERELASLRRRNPDFDSELDRSQMTKELQKWFDRNNRRAA